jgi:hypothetical protein
MSKKVKKYWIDLTPTQLSILQLSVRVLINKCAQGNGEQEFKPYSKMELYKLIEKIDKWSTGTKLK